MRRPGRQAADGLRQLLRLLLLLPALLAVAADRVPPQDCGGGFGADFGGSSLIVGYRPGLLHLPTATGEHGTVEGCLYPGLIVQSGYLERVMPLVGHTLIFSRTVGAEDISSGKCGPAIFRSGGFSAGAGGCA